MTHDQVGDVAQPVEPAAATTAPFHPDRPCDEAQWCMCWVLDCPCAVCAPITARVDQLITDRRAERPVMVIRAAEGPHDD